MSKLGPNQMTARKVETLKDGSYSDGGNLWITVRGKSRVWSLRYKSPVTGKRREMGLGPARDVSLAAARDEAAAARKLLRARIDPIEERKRLKAESVAKVVRTFRTVAVEYVEEQKPGWRKGRSAPIWISSLERLVYPIMGDTAIESVSTDDVLKVLRPIWANKTETADRLRGRLERILDYALTHGWREGDNPARWRGHLANILPKPSTVAQVEHHAAVHWREIARVMSALEKAEGIGALAVRFACLTAARSLEVREARWSEIDLREKTWTLAAERMKAKKEHRVPLSEPAVAILRSISMTGDTVDSIDTKAARAPEAFIFPGGRPKRPLSDVALSKALHLAAGTKDVTVHGLRSTFRDWVAEATDYPGEVAEMALAHAIGSKVEAAYRRGDLFEKRRELMEAWGKWCSPRAANKVG
jgi:integrase